MTPVIGWLGDTVLVFPFDVAIEGGFPGTAARFARRMARNIQLLLLEESHVGRTLDRAGGSWFVEDLTAQLAKPSLAELSNRRGNVAASSKPRLHRGPDR